LRHSTAPDRRFFAPSDSELKLGYRVQIRCICIARGVGVVWWFAGGASGCVVVSLKASVNVVGQWRGGGSWCAGMSALGCGDGAIAPALGVIIGGVILMTVPRGISGGRGVEPGCLAQPAPHGLCQLAARHRGHRPEIAVSWRWLMISATCRKACFELAVVLVSE
jgi:hypothetical protein